MYMCITDGHTAAYPTLVKEPPQLSLTSLAPIMSIILQIVIQMAAQVFALENIQEQPW